MPYERCTQSAICPTPASLYSNAFGHANEQKRFLPYHRAVVYCVAVYVPLTRNNYLSYNLHAPGASAMLCFRSLAVSPPWASQLSNRRPTSLKETGLVMKRSTPLVKASLWSRLDARPVRAMIRAGDKGEGLGMSSAVAVLEVRPRFSSMSRMARVASKPFMTGMLISGRAGKYGANECYNGFLPMKMMS